MIYYRVELWPHGDKSKATLLHEAVIYNTGEGTPTSGNYKAFFSRRGGFGKNSNLPAGDLKSVSQETTFEGFKRLNQSAWRLLGKLFPKAWL